MLQLNKICKSYNKNGKYNEVLKEVNYEFKKSTFYVIKGKSGAGKTTLTKILGLLNNYDTGSYIIDGVDTSKMNEDEKSAIRANKIGFVFQNYYLNPNLTALENVTIPLYIANELNKQEKEEKASKFLEKIGLKDRIDHYPRELSGGEQQRVAIARALINDPLVILADEPTGSLDSENTKKILDILANLSKEGKCVIVVTHSTEVLEYADVILNIDNGEIYEEK